MMRCGDVHELASTYLDAELDEARSSALRGHLRVCPACMTLVSELAAVRDTLEDLEPVEPPARLWTAIEQGLARAEIADAQRSRLWLRWHELRPRLLPAAVTLAAAATVVLWLARRPPMGLGDQDRLASHGETDQSAAPAVTSPLAQAAAAPAGDTEFFAQRASELAAADQRYEATLAELRQVIAMERSQWPAAASARLDTRLAAFAAEAERHRRALESAPVPDPEVSDPQVPDPRVDVRSRDALYAVYQAEIAFLEQAAVYGPSAVTGDGADRARSPGGGTW